MNRTFLLLIFLLVNTLRSNGIAEDVEFKEPYLDRWTYPNNSTPGSRGMASVFANSSDWDRMGQFVLGFQTSEFIPTEKGSESYKVESITLTLVTPGEPSFQYDPTYDLFETYLSEDSDPGRPIELHGAGYRNDYSGEDFLSRNTPSFSGGLRTVYPLSWDEEGNELDVSGNVALAVESKPWAIGKIAGPEEGAYVNEENEVIFEIDLTDPDINEYVQNELNAGSLHFVLSSLHTANHQGGFVNFFTSDSPEHAFFKGYSPRMEIKYTIELSEPQVLETFAINEVQIHNNEITLSWNQIQGSEYVLQSSSDGIDWIDIHTQISNSDEEFSISLPKEARSNIYKVYKKE